MKNERRNSGRPASARQLSVGLAAALLTFLPASETWGQSRYRVSTTGEGEFLVEADLARPSAEFSQRAPRSATRPLSAAASVRDISGVTADGRTVTLAYSAADGWITEDRSPVVRLKYRVVADHGEVEWEHGREEVAAHFDQTYFFIGGVFFLIAADQAQEPATIRFDLPQGWEVTAPWSRQGNDHVVDRQLDIYSNAFAMGADPSHHTRAGGVELTWLMSQDLAPLSGRLGDIMQEMPAAYTEFFGGASTDKYSLFLFSEDRTDGGAFRNSLAVRVARPASELEQVVLAQLISHEALHLWLGANGIRGENPNDLYWFTEGFTDYITVRLMHERGLISDELRDQRLANFVRRALIGRLQSPDVSLAQAGARKGPNYAWLYGGGALVALLLDAEMSRAQPNSFRDMMRDLYRGRDERYSLDGLMARMNALSDGRASEILAFVESSPGIPQVRARLAASGIEMAGFTEDEIYLRIPAR